MAGMIKYLQSFRFKGLTVILGVFLAISVVLWTERSGIQYQAEIKKKAYLDRDTVVTETQAVKNIESSCLVLMDSSQADSVVAWEQFERIFMDMKTGVDLADIRQSEIPDFSGYETIVVLMSDLNPLKDVVIKIGNWVEKGGRVLFALTLQKDTYVSLIEQKLGITDSDYGNVLVDKIYIDDDFMIGGGRSFQIPDAYDSAWEVSVGETAKVYAWTDDEKKVPLIWENSYGKGKFVVDNFGLCEKATRGFFAASYSLLTDVMVYPVLNGSVFYLDDFPSPVPSGDGTYIKRDYGLSIKAFYTNIWWPDMLDLAEEHGVKYTGVIIDNYEDDVSGDVVEQEDVQRFQYFGNMLLHQGGELGYHGYNHQPLSLSNVDYANILPYKTWESYDAMKKAMTELIRFGKEMFPGTELSVYVPPSNVLSDEGREMIVKEFPEIRTIASNYFVGDMAYTQEFEAAEDGIVEQPRIISGAVIDDYMELAAVSELNMHFVNTHFIHPDDLLDEDRGARLGWKKLKKRLDEYMDWLYTSAPCLRNLTASELSGAIQRYGALVIDKDVSDQELNLKLDNFYDEAYIMIRMNEGTPGNIEGGELTHITGNLYLLRAKEKSVKIEIR